MSCLLRDARCPRLAFLHLLGLLSVLVEAESPKADAEVRAQPVPSGASKTGPFPHVLVISVHLETLPDDVTKLEDFAGNIGGVDLSLLEDLHGALLLIAHGVPIGNAFAFQPDIHGADIMFAKPRLRQGRLVDRFSGASPCGDRVSADAAMAALADAVPLFAKPLADLTSSCVADRELCRGKLFHAVVQGIDVAGDFSELVTELIGVDLHAAAVPPCD